MEEGQRQQTIPEEDLSAVAEGFHPQILHQGGRALQLQLMIQLVSLCFHLTPSSREVQGSQSRHQHEGPERRVPAGEDRPRSRAADFLQRGRTHTEPVCLSRGRTGEAEISHSSVLSHPVHTSSSCFNLTYCFPSCTGNCFIFQCCSGHPLGIPPEETPCSSE